jgi:hypothetical protein
MNPPTEHELAEYRQMLAELMQRCLESIRAARLPDDAEPILTRSRDE